MQKTSPHAPLSSKENPIAKFLRSLAEPKYRKKEKAFLIEGVKMVEEALRDGLGVSSVIASPSLMQHHGKGVLKLAENRRVEIVWMADRLLASVAESKTPQPVMAVVRMREHSAEQLVQDESKLIVIAHQLQDPGNLGTIIRTAEAAGASGVVVTAATADPFNPKAVRASMGSLLRLPVLSTTDLRSFIADCRQQGFQTAATVLTGGKTHWDADFKKPTLLLLGQEGGGLPEELVRSIDLHVRIPMAGSIESLNVATAAAVVLYEVVRQRTTGGRGRP